MSPYGKHRKLEMLPGALIWATFLFALFFSFFAPIWAIIFIIIFDLYWVFRVCYFLIFLVIAWRKYRRLSRKDWFAELSNIPNWRRIYHIVFFTTYKEGFDVLR